MPSPIVRTNRSGGEVGTSPGINPITPYTTASLDYRASWIAGEMMETFAGMRSHTCCQQARADFLQPMNQLAVKSTPKTQASKYGR